MNQFKEIRLTTCDNVKIAINHYQNGFDTVVIIAPGWCMTKDAKAFREIAQIFTKDYDVITLDFRGHGKSGGFYTFSAKEVFDLETVTAYAKNYKHIYLVGFSLGGALVLIEAEKNKRIDKVIAVSAPAEFGKIENKMWKKAAWYETLKKFELNRFLSLRMCPVPFKKIKPIDIVDKINVPALFIAGEKDPTVYSWHTETLWKNAKCKKKFKLFKNGYHAEDLYLYYRDEFNKICLNWLNDNTNSENKTKQSTNSK